MSSHYSHSKKNRFERFFITISVIISLIVFISPAPLTFADDVPAADTSAPAATTPAPDTTTPPADSTVTTGDAVSNSDTTNVANTNTTNTAGTPADASTTQSSDASSTPAVSTSTLPTDTTVSNTNDASTSNAVDSGAITGGNASSNNGGGGSVATGAAVAAANILNVVNVNIFNSNGFLMMLNNLFGNLGTIDLRDLASALSGGVLDGNTCNCAPLSTTVNNTNVASISNSVVVRADTGGNSASGNGGDGTVTTGNAVAAANVVNIANTNITDSNYMMMVVNNVGNWNGNFILPNANFFSNFLKGTSGNTTVTNNNDATVTNNIGVTANTGGNTATGNDGNSVIQTGNAAAGANVVNEVNQNLFGGSSLILLFRVFGNWSGHVFNTPPGISWQQTPSGVMLYQDPSYTGSGTTSGCNCASGTTTVTNNNSATVNNDVQVFALTGDNEVKGNGGSGTVKTGNAAAGANVVNLVNNNIYGRNWILAIVNIFGDWDGNVSFGEPDLWLGASANAQGNVTSGNHMTFHFTVANKGDADMHHAKLHGVFDNPYVTFDEATTTWDLGTIPAGSTRDVTYDATVGELPHGSTPLALTVSLSGDEPDHNSSDNSDIITFMGQVGNPNDNGAIVTYTADPNIVVTKTNDAPARVSASTTVNYTIKVKNNGGPAYDAQLQDELVNDAGDTITTNSWDLATIKANEEITITYSMNFNEKTPAGVYVNTAHVEALGRNPSVNPLYGVIYESPEASSTVVVLPENDGFPGFVGGGSDNGDATTTVGGLINPKPHAPKIPTYDGSNLNRSGGLGIGLGGNGGSDLQNEIAKYLPLAFSADSVKPFKLGKGSLSNLAGAGFAIPHLGTLDLLILVALVLLLILNRYSWKEIEAKFKNKFASFL
jgi:hypothetical protein